MKRQIIPALAGLMILAVLGWYVDYVAHQEIVSLVSDLVALARFLAYFLGYALILTLALVAVYFVLSVRERVLTRQANRKLAQREAEVLTLASDTHGVFVRDMNSKAVWRPLHLNPITYQNGQPVEPSAMELSTWQTFTLRNRPSALKQVEPQLLPAQIQVDLLTALDSVQRCLIVGASDVGKTTLLQYLVSRRVQSSKVVVIDPHAYPEKWQGCAVIGTGRDYAEINRALTALVQIMTKRYDEIGRGTVVEGQHPRLTILIDEWRAIVQNVKTAGDAIKALLTESRKATMSVFVATHSDRAKPLGLEGEYDLKDGFAVVRLTIVNGQRQATLDSGTGETPAILPGPYHKTLKTDFVTGEFISLEPELTPAEVAILDLHEQGTSFNEIARQVYGHTGGKQTEQIKRVIEKFS